MITVPTRLDLFKALPPGALVAEIGTWRGYLAVVILNNTKVGKLFCVDPWQGQTGVYDESGKEKTVEEHEKDLRETKHHLRGHLPSGRAQIVRGFSIDVARNDRTIPPLDAVYADAIHTYEEVLADLVEWSKRLKPTGVLMGHDWTDTEPIAVKFNWGVKRAVAKFCEDYGWEMTHVTNEPFASYQLQRIQDWRGAEL